MHYFATDPNLIKNPCACIQELSYQKSIELQACIQELSYQKSIELQEENYKNRQILPNNAYNILIYSFLDYCKIGCNSIGLIVKRGLNRTCLCLLETKDVVLYITPYFKSNLIRVKTQLKNSVAFILTQNEHDETCINSKVPSLYELAYANLLLNGLDTNKLKLLVEAKQLPEHIAIDKPTSFIHVPYFQLSAIRAYYNPIITPSIIGCLDPQNHLDTSHELIQEMEILANLNHNPF